jgi:hypothetical protein
MREDLKPLFFWKGLKADIVNYVAICLECQKVKAKHRHPGGLLQPHAILESKWEVISMDFIVGLPLTTRRHDLIFVVVETLTKSTKFIPMHTTYQAPNIDRVFISQIMRLHGVPKRIIFDQGLMFTGRVSKRPWEPNLTLVLRITQRLTGGLNERNIPWRTCCTCM